MLLRRITWRFRGSAVSVAPLLRAALAVLITALAVIAFNSARLGASGHHSQFAYQQVERWTPSSTRIPLREIAGVEERLRESLRYVSSSPSALEQLGIAELARMRSSTTPREALAAARKARQHFRAALRERPTSPFIWANLATAKMYLDEFDQETFDALRHANVLGPWEVPIQLATVFVGLAGWSKLAPGVREVLAQTIERAGVRDASRMYEVVKSYGRLDLVCGRNAYRHLVQGDCKAS